MIIDSHTHVEHLPDNSWDSPPERILKLMDSAGIEKAVIMTYSDSTPSNLASLEYVAQSIKKYPSRLIGYARLDPSSGDKAVELLKHAVLELNFKGLKLHPVSYMIHPNHQLTTLLINEAASLGVPTLFHCGDEEFTLPLQIEKAAVNCPSAKIILGHMGGYFHVEDAIQVAKRCPNVYLETSAMPYPALINKAVKEIGAERVLYASDGPGCAPMLEVKKVKLAGLSKEEETLVFSENIKRLLSSVKEE